jgi:hypothetical protein
MSGALAVLSAGAARGSGASKMLSAETQGLALDFTDNYWYASTGMRGSARVKDAGTPANNYNGYPYGLLSYASPSVKMCRQSDGLYRHGAHNLYLNSASPANQSITLVSGATYAITITGSVSITWSGAYTGALTAGTVEFTAASGTLTGGSTSGSGTVHVRRTPSNSTYLATTSTARYGLPYEWDASGNAQGILVEEARTNLLLYSSDLTNAAWTKPANSCTKTATGLDGVANSASTFTAPTNNATVSQVITSASAARSGSVFLKRRTGTGAVTISLDNGSTETTVDLSSGGWVRGLKENQTLANPTFVLKLATSGDAVDVWCGDVENGAFATSPIETFGAQATRAIDNISILQASMPWDYSAMSISAKFVPKTFGALSYLINHSTGNNRIQLRADNGAGRIGAAYGSGAAVYVLTNSDVTVAGSEYRAACSCGASPNYIYVNGEQKSSSATSYSGALSTSVNIGSAGASAAINSYLKTLVVVPRKWSTTELQGITSS